MVNVLVVGSGGREHALGWKLAQSLRVSRVLYAPGNAGTFVEAKGQNVCQHVTEEPEPGWRAFDATKKENAPRLVEIIREQNVELVVVGPEGPLADGLVDYLEAQGVRVFGCTQKASVLETDKFFSYQLMRDCGVPQARSQECGSVRDAVVAIEDVATENGVVLKARGLAGGKGVLVCDTKQEALERVIGRMDQYGDMLVAERLVGQEFSVFGVSDGTRVRPFGLSVQDHKRLLDGDQGPNTGGMGAYGPAPIAPARMVEQVADEMMTPIVEGMSRMGRDFRGFLYAGMILTEDGPKVLEFNVRFGDPEAQPAMMMLRGDLFEIVTSSLEGRLDEADMGVKDGAALCVVLASQWYPGKGEIGVRVYGLEKTSRMTGVKVFHAGTAEKSGRVVTNGGRVLGVTAYSPVDIRQAQLRAYRAASEISLESEAGPFHYRHDIGDRAVDG